MSDDRVEQDADRSDGLRDNWVTIDDLWAKIYDLRDKLHHNDDVSEEFEAELAAARLRESGLRAALVASVNFFQEASDFAEVAYNSDDTTIWVIAQAGKKIVTEALTATPPDTVGNAPAAAAQEAV